MRVLYVVLALTLAFAAIAFAADQDTTSPMSTAPAVTGSPAQAMLDACVCKCLNVTSAQVAALRAQGCGDGDIAMACAIAAKCGKPASEVVSQYQTSKDWKTTAGVYNLSVSDLASATTMASAEIEAFNLAFCSQFYAIPSSTVLQVRHQGYSWDDTNMMANAAIQCAQPITRIVDLRKQGASWQDIAQKYNVSATALTTPAVVRTLDVCPSPCPAPAAPPCPAPCPAPVTTPLAPCPVPCPAPAPCAAGPVAPAPCPVGQLGPPCVVCDGAGNIIMTLDQANDLYASGYDWLDVAVALNIRRWTGYPVKQVLIDLKSQRTWQNTIIYYGVPADVAYNVCGYPFPRRTIYGASADGEHQRMIARYQKAGAYPVCPPKACVCPPAACGPVSICPVPCPCPVPGAGATTTPSTTTAPTMTPDAGSAPTAPTVPSTTY